MTTGRSRASIPFLAAVMVVLGLGPAARADRCAAASYRPFAAVPGASVRATDYVSKDKPPVRYTMFRGTVPSFDGLPLSVDVTIPCDARGAIPLLSMNHGWTDDKTIWEETGRSDTVGSAFRPGSNAHWNNIWFASRGYAVLTYTMRGWHDSCGPDAPGAIPYVAPPPGCLAYRYWIHTDDQRWEIRDTQWLTGALVQSGLAAPSKLAITGGSYGGGQTIMNALLRDRIRCGGAPQAAGVDACAGKKDGDFAPWTTPDGRRRLRWTVAIPMYTWFDVIEALSPNGRNSDGVAVKDGNHIDPVGVPIQSYLAGLYASGQILKNGYYAPPGVDPTADVTTSTVRTLAGSPFPSQDPVIANTLTQFETFKSARGIPPDGIIPIFWVQGETDPLFTAFHPLQLANELRARWRNYPIKLFFGDIGHDYAAERVDEWTAAHTMMNAFLDHYIKGTGPEPAFDVTAAITRCLNYSAPMELVTAGSWRALHTGWSSFKGLGNAYTTTVGPSEEGILTDPVTQASVTQNPLSYRGCRKIASNISDPNAATWTFPLKQKLTMVGAPVIDVSYTTTSPDTVLAVRLWDVDPSSGLQALVTRGVYRAVNEVGSARRARFEIAPNGYRWAAGHILKIEITSNDEPYYQASNIPGVVAIASMLLTLPAR